VKRLLIGTAISLAMAASTWAADLPVGAPVYKAPMMPSAYSWSGCYLGIEGGGSWGQSQHFSNDFTRQPTLVGLAQTAGIDPSGGLFGGTAGCNYQFGNWVVGLEDDLSWTNNRGTANGIAPFNTTDTFQTSQSWLGTFRGRLGFAWDRWFFYGTGGAAVSNQGIQLCDPVAGCANQSQTVAGWTAGGGIEYAFFHTWSLKLEYLHVDLGTHTYAESVLPGFVFATRNVNLTNDIVRAGINYKFDWIRY
jgi:outer membrane immunogenic protein